MKIPILLLVLLSAFGMAQPIRANTVLVLGDSLSAAYGMPEEQGWVALLEQRLEAEKPSCTIINASISGDTTAGGRARLPQAMARHQPDIVIIELGGNDGLRGLSLAAMQQNLAAMIEAAQQQPARVLLIGMQLPPNYGPRYNQQFEKVYRTLARQYDIALLPSLVEGVGTRSDLMQNDGIHPNREAQPLIAARVWQHLQPLLAEQQQTGSAAEAGTIIASGN
ncbi:MAG: arylesterase [Thiogranum sp.]|nr:arylesterase [Thiogranum sp.]